jgi:hypothetical protein
MTAHCSDTVYVAANDVIGLLLLPTLQCSFSLRLTTVLLLLGTFPVINSGLFITAQTHVKVGAVATGSNATVKQRGALRTTGLCSV